jgi:hypothetical protein
LRMLRAKARHNLRPIVRRHAFSKIRLLFAFPIIL